MGNRLQAFIDNIQSKIDKRVVSPETLAAMDKSLHTEQRDLIDYQNLQAAAFASGKLTEEEATQLYGYLGKENPTEEKWDKLSIATRVAITQMMLELIDWRISLGNKFTGITSAKIPVKRKRTTGKTTGAPSGLRGVK